MRPSLLQNGAVLFMLTGLVASAALVALRPLLSILGGAMMDSGSDASIAEVIDMALPYYDTLVWSVFPAMIFFTFKQFLEGIGNTRTAMVVIIICNAVNILFNWMLIFGKCGFEPMGAVGAGIATLISRICMCVMIAAYFFRSKRFKVYTEALRMGAFRLGTMLRILKVGIPISFQMFMEASIFVVANIMVLAFGAHALSLLPDRHQHDEHHVHDSGGYRFGDDHPLLAHIRTRQLRRSAAHRVRVLPPGAGVVRDGGRMLRAAALRHTRVVHRQRAGYRA